jgi:hypothetical protein
VGKARPQSKTEPQQLVLIRKGQLRVLEIESAVIFTPDGTDTIHVDGGAAEQIGRE